MAKNQTEENTAGTVAANATEATFTAARLIKSQQFSAVEKNVLTVVLDSDREYTIAEAKAAIEEFKKKEVK